MDICEELVEAKVKVDADNDLQPTIAGVTYEPGAKIAVHEAGHLLGLEHCR